jgi:hypothetical protein
MTDLLRDKSGIFDKFNFFKIPTNGCFRSVPKALPPSGVGRGGASSSQAPTTVLLFTSFF